MCVENKEICRKIILNSLIWDILVGAFNFFLFLRLEDIFDLKLNLISAIMLTALFNFALGKIYGGEFSKHLSRAQMAVRTAIFFAVNLVLSEVFMFSVGAIFIVATHSYS